jgi:hypothetical protein
MPRGKSAQSRGSGRSIVYLAIGRRPFLSNGPQAFNLRTQKRSADFNVYFPTAQLSSEEKARAAVETRDSRREWLSHAFLMPISTSNSPTDERRRNKTRVFGVFAKGALRGRPFLRGSARNNVTIGWARGGGEGRGAGARVEEKK